MGDNKSFITT